MLTRSEILEALRKMGYRKMADLKRCCRQYERLCVSTPEGRWRGQSLRRRSTAATEPGRTRTITQ